MGQAPSPRIQAVLDERYPFEAATNLVIPYRSGEAHYQDEYDPGTDQLSGSDEHPGATAVLPVIVNGRSRGVLGVALYRQRRWSREDRAMLATVGRQLTLALERAESVAHLAEERRRLAAANEELVAFTYSVSHDLRTPVRHVTSFVHLLRQSLDGGMGPKAARYLNVVEEAAGRMNTLIDGIVQVSRTSRLTLSLGPVDLGALVDGLRRELRPGERERRVDWGVAPLPVVTGDGDTLRQALWNLLDNALKFTRTREVARIEVWAEERPDEWAVFVRDNGVGFDPRYAERLFGIFQRLHRQEEFEGAGVGLANVRRIINRHGGRVTAEGQPGVGATFGFTLPRRTAGVHPAPDNAGAGG